MRNKKVLITGVTGMVGSHLTDLLLKKTNWKIYGMCRWRSPLNNLHHLLDLANKMNLLASNSKLQKKISFNAFELIKREFSQKRVLKIWSDLINK